MEKAANGMMTLGRGEGFVAAFLVITIFTLLYAR